MTTVKIIAVNVFNDTRYEFNAKVAYRAGDRSHIACVFIDFFNKQVHCSKGLQQQGCFIAPRFEEAINRFAVDTGWRFEQVG